MSATLTEIAAQAGVSVATVSRVLNGRPGVSADKQRAVLTALDVCGYERPGRLQTTRAGLIGLIVPELSNPIFPSFAQFLESGLISHGYASVLCTQQPGGIAEDDYTELLLERGVAGIVFVCGLHADARADTERYQRLLRRRLPIVLINGHRDGLEAPLVSTDDEAAVQLAVRHLASLGHHRIGLALGQERYLPSIGKKAGYVAAMTETLGPGAVRAAWIRHTLFTVEGGHAAAQRLLDDGCTAICCGSDTMAIGAIRAAKERGLAVPGDVSVVGYDDSPLMAYVDPPLTTVRQPVRAMSQAAVTSLMDGINGADPAPRRLSFHPELVVRSSTGPAPR
ncbi:LacI family DNA-binding transcriptional regulator [Nocardiopsis rhodophaea]|uniref:LacI family DNA-binding transcriptional regulator n=1 Tax=Nocardiopsis rhodophaea TaxID=280238 RepID=A0ABP5F1X2_9ACTN